jgi:hypothetical protein
MNDQHHTNDQHAPRIPCNDRVWCESCQTDRRYHVNGAGMYICHKCGMDITPDGHGPEPPRLPWFERVPMLSINPDAASRDDVARMAAQWMDYRRELVRLSEIVGEVDAEIIGKLLEDER